MKCFLLLILSALSSVAQLPGANMLRVAVPSSATSGPPASIVGRWSFNEGSGSTAADSVGSNDGTISGATWTTGVAGGGLSFAGTDYVELNPYNYTDNWTYAFWVQRTTTSRIDALLTQQTSTSDGRNIYLYFTTSPDNHLQIDNPYIIAVGSSTAAITDTSWHHIAVTRSGTTWKIYIDGALDNTLTVSTTQESNAAKLRFGRNISASTGLLGKMDDVVVCNTAIDLAGVQSLYNNPL